MQLISNEIKTAVELAAVGLVSAVFAPNLTSTIINSFTNLNKDRDSKIKELHRA